MTPFEGKLHFRAAGKDDWQIIIDIYNQAILENGKTADTVVQTIESRSEWLNDHLDEKYPILLAEFEGRMIGWCSLSPFRPGRKALETAAEISYYFDKEYRGKGLGTQLINEVVMYAKERGIKNLIAILLDVNKTSINVLEKLGFEKWGHLPNIAELKDEICGQFIYGRSISDFNMDGSKQ